MPSRIFVGVFFTLICISVWSAPIERVLNISVDIVTHQALSTLEIISPKNDFLVVYLASQHRFQSLDIPFSVRQVEINSRQVGSNSSGYSLSLAQLTGQCVLASGTVNTFMPILTLDGQVFTSVSPVSGLADPEQAHVLNLVFPNVVQTDERQSCDGAVGIIVAATF